MSDNTPKIPFVSIKPSTEKNKIVVTWGYRTYIKKRENGTISCAIPSLNIFFTAKDKEAVENKARILSQMFFDNFMIHSKKGIKDLTLELHKMGYSTQKDNLNTIQKLINNKIVPAKFKSQIPIPESFRYSESEMFESEMTF